MITLATFPFKLKMFTLKENLWIKQIWFQLLLYKNLQMYRNETYPIIVEWIKIDGTVSGVFSCWQIYRGYTSTRMHHRILFKVGNDFCLFIVLLKEKRDTNNNFSTFLQCFYLWIKWFWKCLKSFVDSVFDCKKAHVFQVWCILR